MANLGDTNGRSRTGEPVSFYRSDGVIPPSNDSDVVDDAANDCAASAPRGKRTARALTTTISEQANRLPQRVRWASRENQRDHQRATVVALAAVAALATTSSPTEPSTLEKRQSYDWHEKQRTTHDSGGVSLLGLSGTIILTQSLITAYGSSEEGCDADVCPGRF